MKPYILGIKQNGVALVAFIFMISLALTVFMFKINNPANLKAIQEKNTDSALSLAKQALLSFATTKPITGAVNGAPLNCADNCMRPGDLPCPDLNNDGEAENVCNSQASRLGRLPWKTLGVGDIRDGAGERLWYAVSNRYKNNTRVLPLNSETVGTVSLRDATGIVINNGLATSGLVAVIVSAGQPLTRADGLAQSRSSANQNNPTHYLDFAFGEDNANFIDGATNGFILGPIKVMQNNQMVTISNDIILPVTRNDMNAVIEPRVLAEVMQAVLYSFCPDRADTTTRTCGGNTTNDYLPDPAALTDNTCLGYSDIPNASCISDSAISMGRIAVGGNTSSSGVGGWQNQDSNSILSGAALNNWFQQNGWRELVFYARAPACMESTKNCTGAGFLTLNGALTPQALPSAGPKQVVLISGGSALPGQLRATSIDKSIVSNYLEDENLLPLDDIYARYRQDLNKNDMIISIP